MKVDKFIEKFKFVHKNELEEVFTEGNCYYFAIILKDVYAGEIYYLPIENHFICKIENKFYDITGKIEPQEKAYSWNYYKKKYPTEAARIKRDCINFETR